MSNMRVVYDNAADRASSLSASTTAGTLVASNLLSDIKSEVWRSTATTAQLTVQWASSELIGMVALPFCNMSSSSLIRVRGYTLVADAVAVFDTDLKMAAAPAALDAEGWGTDPLGAGAYATGSASDPLGVNTFAFGGGSYATVWFPHATVQKIVVDLSDTTSAAGYIEASRLVAGAYWEAANNVDYGAEIALGENSRHDRTDAGDLRTDRGAIYKTMALSLSMMTSTDRNTVWRIMRGNGMSRPVFLSVAPEATDASEEQAFQIYGKLARQSAIRYQFVNQYTTQLEIEEI